MKKIAQPAPVPWAVIEKILAERGRSETDFRASLLAAHAIESNVVTNWKKRGVPASRVPMICQELEVSYDELSALQTEYARPKLNVVQTQQEGRSSDSVSEHLRAGHELIWLSPAEVSFITTYRLAEKVDVDNINGAVEHARKNLLGRSLDADSVVDKR